MVPTLSSVSEVMTMDILRTKPAEKLAAVLTSAGISHSPEVESIKTIVEYWSKVRNLIEIKADQDIIAAILSMGRILDTEETEFGPEKIVPIFKQLHEKLAMTWDLDGEGLSPCDLAAAFLTSAVISQTEAVETTGSIVQFWRSLRKFLTIRDMYDFIAAILAMGRIMEQKTQIRTANEINLVVKGLRLEISETIVPMELDYELAWAILTATYIEMSETVEKFREIVAQWQGLRDNIVLMDDEDVVACILATGRVRDIDISQSGGLDKAWQIVEKIKTELHAVKT